MTADELVDLVADMRIAQRECRRLHSPPAEDRARELERLVDRAIVEFKGRKAAPDFFSTFFED